MNQVTLIGRLGKDPETHTFSGGGKVTKFSLATSRKYKDKQGQTQEETQWHTCATYGKTAELVEKYLTKGQQVAVQGMIKYNSYEKDGQKKYFTEISVNRIHFMGANSNSQGNETKEEAPMVTDDLPF